MWVTVAGFLSELWIQTQVLMLSALPAEPPLQPKLWFLKKTFLQVEKKKKTHTDPFKEKETSGSSQAHLNGFHQISS